ncbi:sensor histidine kinase [Cellulomonas composti]|uniref:histidine kinase n=1 Tax=Cellulomonas composti TaxID=266130 RepID=A0A511J7X4_9CELL|nr:PAS domain-containing sensor histidine kinase [Cellulomonas composti]GEL94106.1 hypothetical protein CCO02nite_07640 [Cellulomonas composti]
MSERPPVERRTGRTRPDDDADGPPAGATAPGPPRSAALPDHRPDPPDLPDRPTELADDQADDETDDLVGMDQRTLARWSWALGAHPRVMIQHLPFDGLFVVACLTLALPFSHVSGTVGVWLAVLLVVLQVLLARFVAWDRQPDWTQDVLPVLQIVAVASLRAATGGTQSMYTSLVFLPVITLAARPGVRGVVIGALGVAATITVPALIDSELTLTSAVTWRAAFVALVAAVVGVAVHRTTDRLRARTAATNALRASEARLLAQVQADAAELARVAELRRTSRDQLVSVIDSATEQAIIATDAAGMVEVFNRGAERLLEYSAAQVVGRASLVDFHRPGELEQRWEELFGATALDDDPRLPLEALVGPALAGRSESRDWTYVRHDGSEVTVRLAVTRRLDVDGATIGYVVVASDVTAEREAARLKDQFLSLVSHELRTPLTSVLGYLELLTDGTDDLSDEQREYLTVIERNARRQLKLVGDLLLTAQVDAGTFAVAPQRIDAADVARASVTAALPAAEAAGVTLLCESVPSPVDADPLRLAQAVDNLVSNAVKFTPHGGSVRVVVGPDRRADEGAVRISVVDTGIGIPPDELDRLATRFFRATTATRRAIPGIGLGLSIAKAVVDAHGGELQITSTVGEGTAFTIALPPPA